ncbi:FlgO family outer membrane protein [uncultured Paraglaciecola sp.]|uniref:FlgO family outer membrane protein n=1 Tax=uncultured Paraglaciecola sp. TaxID=1765024 RepID=UPI002623C5E4|nr:FlgO family outer membrane protein [uncultured Paraglaciecola sp.]
MFQNTTLAVPTITDRPLALQDYVAQLIADMEGNLQSLESSNAVAVTNFVFANSNYQTTNDLGHFLANACMQELHRQGITTLDYKVTDFIRVTPEGDFSLSRDHLEIKDEANIDYVLVGTMTDAKTGYILHARIVDVANKTILAAAQTLIPSKLVNMLAAEKRAEPANIVKGASE